MEADFLLVGFLNFFGGGLELFCVSAYENDVGAKAAQLMGGKAPDAGARAGHNDVLAFEQIWAEYGFECHGVWWVIWKVPSSFLKC
ncbi:hypothetical protein D3C78_1793460 [compost metagenome]